MVDSGPLGGAVLNLAWEVEGKLGLQLGEKASKTLRKGTDGAGTHQSDGLPNLTAFPDKNIP